MTFISLQNLSAYSLLESPTTIDGLLLAAQKKGYPAIALADIDVTYGFYEFYEKAQEYGIKPIFGLQLTVKGIIDQTSDFRLLFIAKDLIGFKNLLKLSSYSALEGSPQLLTKMAKYLSHLFIITPAKEASELFYLAVENQQLVDNYLRELKKIVPSSSDLFLGVYAAKSAQNYLALLKAKSKQFSLELVALEDIYYANTNSQFERKVLQAIKGNQKIINPSALQSVEGSHALLDIQDVQQRYFEFGLKQAVENTEIIAKKTNVELVPVKSSLPVFKQTKFPNSAQYLKHLVDVGLRFIFKNTSVPEEYQARVETELSVINEMGFADYFLIVWDVVTYAHHEGILTGPGRGSAAGSLVSYALQITRVDPIKYNLLFERFLNPVRKQMPDIDLDIPDKDREKILQYMFKKYGLNHVAQIITFGTFGMKQAVRDTGRVFGLSELELKRWSSILAKSRENNLTDAIAKSPQLTTLVNSSELNKLIFTTAKKIEGLPRNMSTHAAGIVLSDSSLVDSVGLTAGSTNEIPLTQQTMSYVEKLGLLKIDFLGLSNLTLLGNIQREIRKNGTKIKFEEINLADKETIALFARGDTEGIFQFDNSKEVKSMLRQIRPESFQDIVAANALNRPGPSQNIPQFVAAKNSRKSIAYLDPTLEPVLKETYGVMIYQEQVMLVSRIFAGFSLADADLLRRAISKKKAALIEEQKQKFISGAMNEGHQREVALKLFEYIERFGGYGFNKSHAVAYSLLAYWLAYFKVHFPGEFYVAQLNQNVKNQKASAAFLNSALAEGITVKAPDINKSDDLYTVAAGAINIGLSAIKGVSDGFAKNIISVRGQVDGGFSSLTDFLQRIDVVYLKKEVIENIVKVGAFDSLSSNRKQLLLSVDDSVQAVKLSGNNTTIFDILEPKLDEVVDYSLNEKAQLEQEIVGITISQNWLTEAKIYAKKIHGKTFSDLVVGEAQMTVGKLVRIHQILTKKGEEMAFLTFSDGQAELEVTAFPAVYRELKNSIAVSDVCLLKIKTQIDRYDSTATQHLLIDFKKFNFKT